MASDPPQPRRMYGLAGGVALLPITRASALGTVHATDFATFFALWLALVSHFIHVRGPCTFTTGSQASKHSYEFGPSRLYPVEALRRRGGRAGRSPLAAYSFGKAKTRGELAQPT